MPACKPSVINKQENGSTHSYDLAFRRSASIFPQTLQYTWINNLPIISYNNICYSQKSNRWSAWAANEKLWSVRSLHVIGPRSSPFPFRALNPTPRRFGARSCRRLRSSISLYDDLFRWDIHLERLVPHPPEVALHQAINKHTHTHTVWMHSN